MYNLCITLSFSYKKIIYLSHLDNIYWAFIRFFLIYLVLDVIYTHGGTLRRSWEAWGFQPKLNWQSIAVSFIN